jgi:hypothetical protein
VESADTSAAIITGDNGEELVARGFLESPPGVGRGTFGGADISADISILSDEFLAEVRETDKPLCYFVFPVIPCPMSPDIDGNPRARASALILC